VGYVGLKSSAKTLGGAAWLMGTCDPSLFIAGAASSILDIAKTFTKLGNRSGSRVDHIID
jgi:hypothetical protein